MVYLPALGRTHIKPVSARNEITTETLRRLARLRATGPRVLSVYLNLDPERFATARARASAVRSLIDEANRCVESGSREHGEREQLRADLQHVAEHLRGGGFTKGSHAHAVFCCTELDLFETLSLPEPVENLVAIDATPFLAPLAEVGPPGRWCVALANRRATRLLRGSASNLREVLAFGDRVHGQHSQGGWSQARYARSVERDVDEHLRRTASVLLGQFRRRPFSALLLGSPDELRQRLIDALHSYVRERVAGWVDVDIENSSPDEVRARAASVIEEHEAQHIDAQLERLRAELGHEGLAAAGAEEVLGALHQRRVEALLFVPRQHIEGTICPTCGLMSTESGACPLDGTDRERRDDLLEPALEAAVGQGADIVPIPTPELGPLGGIAALLRF